MNTHHLKYFCDAVRLGGVGKSAELNHVTHPAVSQAIRSLEQELDIQLLSHEKRKFLVTDEGKKLSAWGIAWLHSLASVKSELTETKELSGVLQIAATKSLIQHCFWNALVKFQKQYPLVQLKVHIAIAGEIRKSVASGQSDLGILIDDHLTDDFHKSTIGSGHFCIAHPKNQSNLKQAQLIVTSHKKYEVKYYLDEIRRRYGFTPKIAFELASWSLIRNFVKDAGYFGLVPDYIIDEMPKVKRLGKLKLDLNAPGYDVVAIWNPSRPLSNKEAALLQTLKDET